MPPVTAVLTRRTKVARSIEAIERFMVDSLTTATQHATSEGRGPRRDPALGDVVGLLQAGRRCWSGEGQVYTRATGGSSRSQSPLPPVRLRGRVGDDLQARRGRRANGAGRGGTLLRQCAQDRIIEPRIWRRRLGATRRSAVPRHLCRGDGDRSAQPGGPPTDARSAALSADPASGRAASDRSASEPAGVLRNGSRPSRSACSRCRVGAT